MESQITELEQLELFLPRQAMSVYINRVEVFDTYYKIFVRPPPGNPELKNLQNGVGPHGIQLLIRIDGSEEDRASMRKLTPDSFIIVLVEKVLPFYLQVIIYDAEGLLVAPQHSEIKVLDRICPLLILGYYHKFTIAHVCKEGIFMHKTSFTKLLEDLQETMYEFYSESEVTRDKEWTPGEFCSAFSIAKHQWYRAKILEVGNEIKVQYIDYGNSEILTASNLRKLDPSFCIINALALKVHFNIDIWTIPIEYVYELAQETEYNAIVFRNNGWIAELFDIDGQSLTEKIKAIGFPTHLDSSFVKRLVEGDE